MKGAEKLHQRGKRTCLDVVVYTDRDSSNKTVVKLGVDVVPSSDGHSLGTKDTLRVLLHEVILYS